MQNWAGMECVEGYGVADGHVSSVRRDSQSDCDKLTLSL